MAISINGVTVAGIGKDGKNGTDGKDATINGVNALTIEATGGIKGTQSGDTYTIDGSGILTSANEYTDNIVNGMVAEFEVDHGIIENIFYSFDRAQFSVESEIFNMIMQNQYSGIKIFDQTAAISFSLLDGFVEGEKTFKAILQSHVFTSYAAKVVFITFSPSSPNTPLITQSLCTPMEYFDSTIGNINTILDTINGEVI